ncbi:hypothetical protein IFM89_022567 [Coptis chinensis]|uniref:Uncharacterized protein n=1 Tax=Coptis chinensis TaxID=261450 RepID=A0A835H878_9MAGN|nr:hypothetical protein IFM89_022567 [Coptis chinensis]
MVQEFAKHDMRSRIIYHQLWLTCFMARTGTGRDRSFPVYAQVVRTGVPRVRGRSNNTLVKIPFLLIMLGTVTLGCLNASRAYQRQRDAYPSHNPFLP